jgi:capsule polysaccharide export protein KpsE/RkpR
LRAVKKPPRKEKSVKSNIFKILAFFFIITIPVFFAIVVWQANRYNSLDKEVVRLEEDQEQWVNASKRLIAGGASYMSAERIEAAAKRMNLEKVPPENIIQVQIYQEK